MGWISFTSITCAIFFIYAVVTLKTFYDMFFPASCVPGSDKLCIKSIKNWQDDYSLSICIPNTRQQPSRSSQCEVFAKFSDSRLNNTFSKDLSIELPSSTLKNGTFTIYAVLAKNKDLKSQSVDFTSSSLSVIKPIKLSKYKLNKTKIFVNLLENANEKEVEKVKEKVSEDTDKKPITHLLTSVNVLTLDSEINFDRNEIPPELFHDLMLTENNHYLPIMHFDRLSVKDDDYYPLNKSQTILNLVVNHIPASIGKMRFFKQMEASMEAMKGLGFNDAQLSEITSIFTDNSLYILLLTFFVSIIHLLFEFLAFKNDINYWRKRKTTVGLSLKTLGWRAISQIIIFIYLFEEETSLLILVPSGISILIEIWKMCKAFKVKVEFKSGIIPSFSFGESSKEEKESNSYDSIAMKKLSYVLYPLCIGGAVYSLVYNTHKNWYSWLINSLVNGVYAFGFLFMTPQLFVNYKLKSVAHLPWKAFMYKAFNTFIDDVFAFIIKMPTMHRLACLRDDVVFLVYLYQRWLYPIDKTRTNEFGESFDEDKTKKE